MITYINTILFITIIIVVIGFGVYGFYCMINDIISKIKMNKWDA